MTRTYRTTRITTVESIPSDRPRQHRKHGMLEIVGRSNGFVGIDATVPTELAEAILALHRDYCRAADAIDRARR